MPGDLLSIRDLSLYQFNALLDLAQKIKEKPSRFRARLEGKILAMIFPDPSLRIRAPFEAGLLQMGGKALCPASADPALGAFDTPGDLARSLDHWVDGIVIGPVQHRTTAQIAASSSLPVINALSDRFNPCQALSDFFTLREKTGDLARLTIAFIGCGGPVCHSLTLAAAMAGSRIRIGAPAEHSPLPDVLKEAEDLGRDNGFSLTLTHDPLEAVSGADVVYTDLWPAAGRMTGERPTADTYHVDPVLMSRAKPTAAFMHPLPANRGKEVSGDMLDSDNSLVFQQAENRLHMNKAIMLSLLETRTKNE